MMSGGPNPYTEVVVPHVPLARVHCQEQDKAAVRVRGKSGEGYPWEGEEDQVKLDCMTDVPEEASGVAREPGLPAT